MTRRPACIAALAIALIAAAADDAVACSCPPHRPACEAAWNADVVFAGTVQTISHEGDDVVDGVPRLRVVFAVEQGFVHAAPGLLAVTTGESEGGCGYKFEAGKRYLVYAQRAAPWRISTGRCSRTRLLAEANDDLSYLRSLTSPAAGGRVYGRITEARRDPSISFVTQEPVEGVTVVMSGTGLSRTAITDHDGRYEFAGPVARKLTVSIQPPLAFDSTHVSREIELRDPRGCSEQDFELHQIGRVAGWVVDPDGQPLAGIDVDAVAVDVARVAEFAGAAAEPLLPRAQTDARGRFEFSDLPPGTYVFGINLTQEVAGAPRRSLPTFLPGAASVHGATVVELKPHDDKDVGILRLIRP